MLEIQLIQVFILIGAAQGFLLGAAILRKYYRNASNKLLGFSFIILSFRLAIYPFRNAFDFPAWKFISDLSLLLLLVIGPSLYLFVKSKISSGKVFTKASLLHFTPFGVYFTHLLNPSFYLPLCYSYATLTSGIVYGLLSLYSILTDRSRIRKANEQSLSYHSKLYSFALPLFIVPVLIWVLAFSSQTYLGFHPATIPYLGLTLVLYRIGFKTASDPRYVYNTFLNFDRKRRPAIDAKKIEQLIKQVEEHQLYLDSTLNIQKLSLSTGLSRHEISQLLNDGLNTTYNDFINGYRIEASKMKLIDTKLKHLSIEGIAMESGFKSKSTFNQAFKSQTALTPSEYKKMHLKKMCN